jgi:hypothetical protein
MTEDWELDGRQMPDQVLEYGSVLTVLSSVNR